MSQITFFNVILTCSSFNGSIVRAVFFIFYFSFQVDCSILVIWSKFFPSSPDPIDHIGYCHHFVGIRTAWPIETNFDGNVPWAQLSTKFIFFSRIVYPRFKKAATTGTSITQMRKMQFSGNFYREHFCFFPPVDFFSFITFLQIPYEISSINFSKRDLLQPLPFQRFMRPNTQFFIFLF